MASTDSTGRTIIVGVTGASGAVLARTTLRLLAADQRVARVHLVITDAGHRLLAEELGIASRVAELPAQLLGGGNPAQAPPKSTFSPIPTSAPASPPAAIPPTPCA